MALVRGTDLTPEQKAQVKRAFMYRLTYENQREHPALVKRAGGVVNQSDSQWIDDHAFNILKSGKLGRGSAQPHYMAKENPHVDARTVLKSGRSMLARVKRVGNKLVIQPVARVAKRAVKRVRRMANPTWQRVAYSTSKAAASKKADSMLRTYGLGNVKLTFSGGKFYISVRKAR